MKLDFGTVKSYKNKGYGFVRGFINQKDFFFHISSIFDPRIKQFLDSWPNISQSESAFWFVYAYETRGPYISHIWGDHVRDIPDHVLLGALSNIVARLDRQEEITHENEEPLSQLFWDQRIPDHMLNPLVSSNLLLSAPGKTIRFLRASQYAQYDSELDVLSYWEITKELPKWLEPVTKTILGTDKLHELRRQRERKVAEEEAKQAELEAQRRKQEERKRAENEARRKAEIRERAWQRTQQIMPREPKPVIEWYEQPKKEYDRIQFQKRPEIRYKADRRDFERIVQERQISALYHFTDAANLSSIKYYGGLFSWAYLEENCITIARPGGGALSQELDVRKGLQDYVRLSFNRGQPMLYVAQREGRINNPVTLEIDPSLIYWQTTLFSNINATDNEARIGGDLASFKRINFKIALGATWTNEIEKKLYQAEVLVMTHIPLEFIKIPAITVQKEAMD
jgi:hypothetical protein